TEDAGKFLARVGYPNTVLGGKAELAGSLRWAGEPTTLDYASLGGELKLSAEDGQFLEIDPGFGKLISHMNLQALPRRITLDFRDVFSKGFRFDRIEAASTVDHGVMDIRQFRMRGPAAEVAMSGRVDLAHETQTLKVRVVPSLGGSARCGGRGGGRAARRVARELLLHRPGRDRQGRAARARGARTDPGFPRARRA